MKNNKIIIYDDSCPLCAVYTKGFVSAGMIKKENRKNFTSIDPALLSMLDTKRCQNEIPVIDNDTNQVFYGIDAITEILQTKIPFVKKIVQLPFVKWPLTKLYKLVSYNRRVIVAGKAAPGNFDCTPDFNYRYRLVFMSIFLVFNTAILFPIHHYILENSFSSISVKQLMLAHFLLVALNMTIACFLNRKTAFEYLGQVNMLALTTILVTLPLMFLNKFHLIQHAAINNFYLFMLSFFVFREYKRRMHFAGIIRSYPVIYRLNILTLCSFIILLLY
ncbi:MAG: DCC1-like thiol-disulfide oxidoreductase family protein [Ferruginibacter sp.]